MLIKFTSSSAGELIMLSEHARRLFEIIGKERTARGVFVAEQLPEALARLHAAVEAERAALHEAEQAQREQHNYADEENPEEKAAREEEYMAGRIGIHLAQRAQPLINLMEWTLKEQGFILWEAAGDF